MWYFFPSTKCPVDDRRFSSSPPTSAEHRSAPSTIAANGVTTAIRINFAVAFSFQAGTFRPVHLTDARGRMTPQFSDPEPRQSTPTQAIPENVITDISPVNASGKRHSAVPAGLEAAQTR